MNSAYLSKVGLAAIARGGFGAQTDNAALMTFIADRLVNVHGESPNTDYILELRKRAKLLIDSGVCEDPATL